MKQSSVKNLLEEAAKRDCSCERRKEILNMFTGAGDRKQGSKQGGIGIATLRLLCVMCELYDETIANKPESLMGLFPFFSYVCAEDAQIDFTNIGSSTGRICIDWSLV